VLLVIDVQGAAQVRAIYPRCYSIFLRAPDDVYEARLRDRGDDESAIGRRLMSAKRELERIHEYNEQLINDQLPDTVQQLETIIARQFAGRPEVPNAR